MASNLVVNIPDNLRQFEDPLRDFFQGMVRKLAKNAHKSTPTTKDIPAIMDLLQLEILEFEDQLLVDKYDENSLIELMDTANFAFLAYFALRLQGVKHEK